MIFLHNYDNFLYFLFLSFFFYKFSYLYYIIMVWYLIPLYKILYQNYFFNSLK